MDAHAKTQSRKGKALSIRITRGLVLKATLRSWRLGARNSFAKSKVHSPPALYAPVFIGVHQRFQLMFSGSVAGTIAEGSRLSASPCRDLSECVSPTAPSRSPTTSNRVRRAVVCACLLALLGCAQSRPAHSDAGATGHDATARHSFADVEHWTAVFDDPGRAAWQKPAEVVRALALQPGQVVAELEAAGFALTDEPTFLPYQYFLIFQTR